MTQDITSRIAAKIILDSHHPSEEEPEYRLTTMVLTLPRFILAQLNKHRKLVNNVGSSRAKPVKFVIEAASPENRFVPSRFGINQPGMQAAGFFPVDSAEHAELTRLWNEDADRAIETALKMSKIGASKELVNRILEPYVYVDALVTASSYENFLNLRMHSDSQPEIQELAKCVHNALMSSTPTMLRYDEWHIPYVTDEERQSLYLADLLKISTARNARISYRTFDGRTSSFDDDMRLFGKLVADRKHIHASPTEHIAQAVRHKVKREDKSPLGDYWYQYRRLVEYQYAW